MWWWVRFLEHISFKSDWLICFFSTHIIAAHNLGSSPVFHTNLPYFRHDFLQVSERYYDTSEREGERAWSGLCHQCNVFCIYSISLLFRVPIRRIWEWTLCTLDTYNEREVLSAFPTYFGKSSMCLLLTPMFTTICTNILNFISWINSILATLILEPLS